MVRLLVATSGLVGCTPDVGRAPSVPVPSSDPTAPVAEAPTHGWDRGVAPIGWPAIVVNEVLPGNDSIHPDEHGDYDDYVELYNPTSSDVDLSGWSLADDPDPDWLFPAGTLLPARGHLLVWADGEPEEGPLHASLSLSGAEEAVWLFTPDEQVADELAWPPLQDDVVYGRFPSGGVNRAASILATPWNFNPADPGLSIDPTDALFPPGGVIRIELMVAPADLRLLEDHDRAVVPAGVGFEGGFVSSAGLTLKGGLGSRRSINEKAAFRVNLDEFTPGLRLRGLETLTLNNMVQDPSTLHELLAYGLLRDAGVPAPRVTHVELYLNGEYRGLYLNVETVDDQFLKRWFPDDPFGNLYEGTYGVDLTPSQVEDFDLDEVGVNDVTDRSELEAISAFLAGPATEAQMPEFEARVDLEEVLSAMAAEAVFAHWDGYQYSANNYRIYHEPSIDQWSLIPSGLDQTFEDERGLWDGDAALIDFCLQIPSCRTRYDLKLAELSYRLLALDCPARVAEVLPGTMPLYELDPYKEQSVEALEQSVEDTLDFCEEFPRQVLRWL